MAEALPRDMGPYRLLEQLGAGGMGIVYRAEDRVLGREVAVKVLHPHLLTNQEFRARFAREARLHAALSHPNVVTLYNLHEDGGNIALVMEMVTGRNLKEYLASPRPLTLDHLIDIAVDILKGLSAAHQRGLVHRDLKPANILISDSQQVKLMDFGLAKQENSNDDLTQTGALVGSFRYMAPEQILHESVDARTDLYAFGVILFQMLTGTVPFDSTSGGNEFEIMEKQLRAEPPSPLALNPALPQALANLIQQLMAKKPQQRPQDCQSVIHTLKHIQLGYGNSLVSVASLPPGATESLSSVTIAKGLIGAAMDSLLAFVRDRRVIAVLLLLALSLVAYLSVSGHTSQQAPDSSLNHSVPLPLFHDHDSSAVEEPAPVPQRSKEAMIVDAEAMGGADDAVAPPAPASVREASREAAPEEPVIRLATEQPYTLQRSDYSKMQGEGEDEFYHGQHIYFEELRDYPLKEHLHTFKSGYSRLTFATPQAISRIIIHRASIGTKDFSNGYIRLMIRQDGGSWLRLLDQQDRDITSPETVVISDENRTIKEVKLTFRSPEPLTLGSIDMIAAPSP